jgi:signal transduction histidine kinase
VTGEDRESLQAALRALEACEARQRFMQGLSARLRSLADPDAIRAEAARAVGWFLGLPSAGYVEVEPDGDAVRNGREHADGRMPARLSRLSEWGAFGEAIRRGEDLFVEDYATDPRGPPGGPDASRAIRLRAAAAIPLVKEGRLVALLYALSPEPRRWPPEDRALLRDVADRTFEAVARGLAEEGQRDAEARGRSLLAEAVGMLSHELRNALSPARNAVAVLAHAGASEPQQRRAREVIGRQVGHLARFLDDLLDVTRIARGKIELRRERIDLAAISRQAAEDQRALVEGKGLVLSVEVPPEPLWVDGDPVRLAQVVSSLLQSAARLTPAGGRVEVVLRGGPEHAALRVRDGGQGLDPALVARAFEPFVHGPPGGLGLGLALVKGIAELHGGRAEIASAGTGEGTEVTVLLPARAGGPAGA